MTTWREQLDAVRESDAIIARAPDVDAVWDREFDDHYGGAEGEAVLAWSETRVYFPVTYDGSEWLDHAPRNPQPGGQYHVGGG